MSYNTSDQLILQESIVATTVPVYLIFSFGFIGNGLAFYVLISSSKNHKWVPFQRLVLGLLTTDTGALLLMFPVILVRFVSDFTYVFPTSLCNFSSFTLMFTMTSSALIVCMMSLDRFVAVVFPFTYKVQNKRSRANITLLSVWIFSAMFSCTHLLGFGSNFNFYPGTWCFLNYMGKSALDRASSFVFAVFGIIVVLVTVVTNCVVIVSLCRSQSSPQKRNHSFTIVFLMVLVLLFLLCTAPIMVRKDHTVNQSLFVIIYMFHDLIVMLHDLIVLLHDTIVLLHDIFLLLHDIIVLLHDIIVMLHDIILLLHDIIVLLHDIIVLCLKTNRSRQQRNTI